jgi:hypothetical protein
VGAHAPLGAMARPGTQIPACVRPTLRCNSPLARGRGSLARQHGRILPTPVTTKVQDQLGHTHLALKPRRDNARFPSPRRRSSQRADIKINSPPETSCISATARHTDGLSAPHGRLGQVPIAWAPWKLIAPTRWLNWAVNRPLTDVVDSLRCAPRPGSRAGDALDVEGSRGPQAGE